MLNNERAGGGKPPLWYRTERVAKPDDRAHAILTKRTVRKREGAVGPLAAIFASLGQSRKGRSAHAPLALSVRPVHSTDTNWVRLGANQPMEPRPHGALKARRLRKPYVLPTRTSLKPIKAKWLRRTPADRLDSSIFFLFGPPPSKTSWHRRPDPEERMANRRPTGVMREIDPLDRYR